MVGSFFGMRFEPPVRSVQEPGSLPKESGALFRHHPCREVAQCGRESERCCSPHRSGECRG
jgi:hypothetical protein